MIHEETNDYGRYWIDNLAWELGGADSHKQKHRSAVLSLQLSAALARHLAAFVEAGLPVL